MALTKINASVIANNTIAVGNIADNSVDATKIASNSILTRHIDDNQVTTDQIAANTIATANIADNAVDGTKIASNSILTRHIDDNQVTGDQLSDNITIAGTLGVTGDANFDSGTLFVDVSANKVGVGTDTPSTKLHLGGTAPGDSIIRQDSTSSGTNWEIGERAAGKWQIFEDDNDSIVATFKSDGKVGIGNTNPGAKLDVVATSGEVFRADSNGGAYRLVATQTGVNLQGVVDVLGTTLIHNVSNYTGLEVKGSGGSRPMIQWSNANNGDLCAIYGTEGNAMILTSGSSNTTAITIDSSQRINMPGQPCFSAALPAVTNAGNVIVWGGEHLDVGGHFNTSNGRFTAPIAGNYFFSFWILLDPSGAGHYSRVLFGKNGGYSTQWTDNLESTDAGATAAYHSVGGSAIIPMAANDYITLKNDGQSPTYGTEYGNWSGFLVS